MFVDIFNSGGSACGSCLCIDIILRGRREALQTFPFLKPGRFSPLLPVVVLSIKHE